MTRQQRRFEARKGIREVGFTHVSRRARLRDLLPDAKADLFQWLGNGGYRTLHPTKGWRIVSPKRLKFFPGATA